MEEGAGSTRRQGLSVVTFSFFLVFFFLGYGNPEGVPPPSSGVGASGAGGPGGAGIGGAGGASGGPGGVGGPMGPGPQRGGSYNQPSQSQGYHPYRRV